MTPNYLIVVLTLIFCLLVLSSEVCSQTAVPSKQLLSEYLAAVGFDNNSAPEQLFIYGKFEYLAKGSEEPEITGSFEEFRALDDYRLTVYYYTDSLLAVGRSPVHRFVDQPGLSNLVHMGSQAARNFDVVPFLNFVADDSAHVNPETGDWQLLMNDSDGIRWRVDFNRESFLPVKAEVSYNIALLADRCTFVYTYLDYELYDGLRLPSGIVKSGCDYGVIQFTIAGAEVVGERLDRELFRVLSYRSLLRRHPEGYQN